MVGSSLVALVVVVAKDRSSAKDSTFNLEFLNND